MKNLFTTFAVLATVACAATFAACEKGGGDSGGNPITIPDPSQQTQTANADETVAGNVTFTAKAAWTATVAETTPSSRAAAQHDENDAPATRADDGAETAETRAPGVSWVHFMVGGQETYSGAAGTVNAKVELDPNYTGAARAATITLRAGDGEGVPVTVTQAATDANGNVPSTPLAFAGNAAFDIPASVTGVAITNIDAATGVSGGTKPYTFSATGLPEGITISTAGMISGTPTTATAAGSAKIKVEDSTTPTKQSAEITIAYGAVTANTIVPVTGITGVPTTGTAGEELQLMGTVAPADATNKTIEWSVTDAGTTGVDGIFTNTSYVYVDGELYPIVTVSVAPVAAGTLVVCATIANGKAVGVDYTEDFTIEIGPASDTPLAFADNAAFDIPASVTGTAIANIDVATGVSGGKTPYKFRSRWLPAGITISTAGVISGTPTNALSAGTTTVTVEDSSSPKQSASITIAYGAVTDPFVFTDNAAFDIPESVTDVAITNIDAATGVSGGTKPYTFSLAPGSTLPAGITISTAGVISGTPTTVAPAGAATVRVEDNSTPRQSAEITIACGAITPAGKIITTKEIAYTTLPHSFTMYGRGNASIDWGDGTAPETVTLYMPSKDLAGYWHPGAIYSHKFTSTGAKTVTITGDILTFAGSALSALDVTRMPGLLFLSLSDNSTLTSLDLSKNTLLEELHLTAAQMTSIDLSAQKALRVLKGGGKGCLVTSLDLSACKDIEDVYWPGNNNYGQWGLSSIKVNGLTKLKTLAIHYSHTMLALDVSGCTALETLSCEAQGGGNHLGSGLGTMTTLNAGGCASLREIDCSGQQISSLTLTGCTALESLNAGNTRLMAFDASGHPALNWLNVNTTDLAQSRAVVDAMIASLPARTGLTQGRISFRGVGYSSAYYSFSIEGHPYYTDAIPNIIAYLSAQGKNWTWRY